MVRNGPHLLKTVAEKNRTYYTGQITKFFGVSN